MFIKRLFIAFLITATLCSSTTAQAAPSACEVINEAIQQDGLSDEALNALYAASSLCQGQEPPTKEKCKLAAAVGGGTTGTYGSVALAGPACAEYNKCGNYGNGGQIPCVGMEMYCVKCKVKNPFNGGCTVWDDKKSKVSESCGCYTDDGLKNFCDKAGKDEKGKQKDCTVSYYDEDGKNDKDCKDFKTK